jgi:arylsulfatase A-like enzyme
MNTFIKTNRSNFRSILTYILLSVVITSFSCSSKAGTPNILCILVDDLGYGDLSCQGAMDLLTPNIDRLGEEGMTFKNFYANCPVCSPSRASLLTGKYPDMVGVPGVIRQFEDNSWGYLDPEAVFLPQILKKQGYQTAIIGKWHLGFEEPNIPNSRGFDYFKGFLGDMMDDYWTHLRGGINWMRLNREIIDPKGHATDLFTDWTIEYMKERANDKQPFFLYLAYNAPHFPIQPPEDYLNKVLKREKSIDEKRAKNVAFIEHLDHSIGRIMKCLAETGLIENTLVLFTSDNGGSIPHAQSNGNLHGGKQQMFEGGIKVPALAVWKDKIQPGSQSENMALLMDIYTTFCKIAGADLDHRVDGVDLSPTILGKSQNTDDRYVFWVRREGGKKYNGQSYYAARYGPYKMLQNSAFEPYLYYNLEDDPLEQNPLDPENSRDFNRLRNELQSHIQKSGSIPWQHK